MVGEIPTETVTEVREDPPEELAESNWPAKGSYGWVAADVRNQSSLFWWSRLLNSWLNCTPVIAKGVSGSIVSLEGERHRPCVPRARRGQPRSSSICTCATSLSYMCGCRWTISPWVCCVC